jgi:DNA-binding NarL/FixJ family response regulator
MNKIRVLLIEDNPFLRNGIEALLNQQPDIKVIKAAADFENAASSLSACKNGVVLLDVSLHDQNSLRVTEKLSSATLGPVIIVMDLFPQKEEIDEFEKAGAVGFINKDATLDEFLVTIRAVAGGARVLPGQLPGSLFSQIVEHAARCGTVRLDEKALNEDQPRCSAMSCRQHYEETGSAKGPSAGLGALVCVTLTSESLTLSSH